jgi:hypothetical protein
MIKLTESTLGETVLAIVVADRGSTARSLAVTDSYGEVWHVPAREVEPGIFETVSDWQEDGAVASTPLHACVLAGDGEYWQQHGSYRIMWCADEEVGS